MKSLLLKSIGKVYGNQKRRVACARSIIKNQPLPERQGQASLIRDRAVGEETASQPGREGARTLIHHPFLLPYVLPSAHHPFTEQFRQPGGPGNLLKQHRRSPPFLDRAGEDRGSKECVWKDKQKTDR